MATPFAGRRRVPILTLPPPSRPLFSCGTARFAAVRPGIGGAADSVHLPFTDRRPFGLGWTKGDGMRGSIGLGALLLALLPGAAQAMSVKEFLAKAHTLQAKGTQAASSPDFSRLRREITDTALAYRVKMEADRKAGRPPRSCPPPKGEAQIDASALVANFETIPAARRRMSVKSAFYAFMDERYPCAEPAKSIRSGRAGAVRSRRHRARRKRRS
jgi:hypothetical protein